jgi:hypothetical protein
MPRQGISLYTPRTHHYRLRKVDSTAVYRPAFQRNLPDARYHCDISRASLRNLSRFCMRQPEMAAFYSNLLS